MTDEHVKLNMELQLKSKRCICCSVIAGLLFASLLVVITLLSICESGGGSDLEMTELRLELE